MPPRSGTFGSYYYDDREVEMYCNSTCTEVRIQISAEGHVNPEVPRALTQEEIEFYTAQAKQPSGVSDLFQRGENGFPVVLAFKREPVLLVDEIVNTKTGQNRCLRRSCSERSASVSTPWVRVQRANSLPAMLPFAESDRHMTHFFIPFRSFSRGSV